MQSNILRVSRAQKLNCEVWGQSKNSKRPLLADPNNLQLASQMAEVRRLAKREIGKHLIGQKGSGLGHLAAATAGAESPLLAEKRHQSLEVTVVAAHPENAVLEAPALQVGLEIPLYSYYSYYFSRSGLLI